MIARSDSGETLPPRRLVYAPRAIKDLRRLPLETRRQVVEAIERYAETGQGDVKKLTDVRPPAHRLRVGDWRVRLSLAPGVVEIEHVRNRREAY